MPRSYSDESLRQAVANAQTWADVAARLGKPRSYNATWIRDVADRLGIDYSHFHHTRGVKPVAAGASLFTGRGRHCAGLVTASRWFLERGYLVSIPIEPGPYDLVTESDAGLQRVQVKTTRRKEGSGRYTASLMRRAYDCDAPMNATGRYRRISYTSADIELFFIITDDGGQYLVPLDATDGKKQIVLDAKYAAFKV